MREEKIEGVSHNDPHHRMRPSDDPRLTAKLPHSGACDGYAIFATVGEV